MILYPNLYLNDVNAISIDILKQNNIKGIILDVDNTLIDYDRNISEETILWCENLKKEGIKFCILSNSNKKDKVSSVAQKLDVPYFYFAKKPLKGGFRKAKRVLKMPNEQIAVVGDQIFTDVLGSNRCNMFSILVNPIKEKDILITVIKRPIEKLIINSYVKKMSKSGLQKKNK